MKKKLPLIVLVIVLVALAGFFLTRKSGLKQLQGGDQQTAVKEMMADCKYDKDICEYMVAQAQAIQEGVVIITTSEIANYGVTTSEMRMDKDGNSEINSYKDNKLESSMIVFGNETYVKDAKDNSWYMMPSGDPTEEGDKQTIDEVKDAYTFDDSIQINKVGSEVCGSLTCNKYEIAALTDEEGQSAKTYVWVDTKEHLARKMEYGYAGGTSTMEYKYEPVAISKPSPIKEMPTMMNTTGDESDVNNQQMPSQADIEKMMQEYSLDGE